MQLQSPWSRGLIVGGICGCVFGAALSVIGFITDDAEWWQVLVIAGSNALFWGMIGFVLGYASRREMPTAGETPSDSKPPRRWVFRILAGLVVAYLAPSVILVIWTFAVVESNPTGRPMTPEERRWMFWQSAAMMSAAAGTMCAGFLGTLIAPFRYDGRAILKSSLMAAVLGAIAGGWFGGSVAMLFVRFLDFHAAMALSLTSGAGGGIVAAVVLRLRVNR